MAHYISEPAASVMLSGSIDDAGAATVGYQTGCRNENIFGGQEHTKVSVMALCAEGDKATIAVKEPIANLTPQMVQNTVRTLNFIRVRFTGLVLEVKGDSYNKISWTGTAERAEVVTSAPAGKS